VLGSWATKPKANVVGGWCSGLTPPTSSFGEAWRPILSSALHDHQREDHQLLDLDTTAVRRSLFILLHFILEINTTVLFDFTPKPIHPCRSCRQDPNAADAPAADLPPLQQLNPLQSVKWPERAE
jgi:hypothetical protein